MTKKKSLSPNDLGKKWTLESCRKIDVNEFVRQAKKSLKRAILEAQLEVEGLEIELTTTKTGFGGERFWFVCPKCGRRCGVLYENKRQQIYCLNCIDTFYLSQQ